jgi:hypothetical protein
MINNKTISIFELIILVFSIVSFAYFVSTDLPDVFERESSIVQFIAKPIIPVVSALSITPSGCCKETISGATCQILPLSQKELCKKDLIGTSCAFVSECQKGCCYDDSSGLCSINSPKEKCVSNGGKWDQNENCEIPQCNMGCCILGNSAAMMTARECTLTAQQYEIDKVFKPLDSKGTCSTYSDSTEIGACLFKSDDYSSKKGCVLTTKSKCLNSGREFRQGYLCTSPELNTSCVKTTKTSCFDGTDGVYFVDSCGNKANVYDFSRATDNNYWNTIIPPKDSCSGSPETCGNCDYTTGSICTKYISGMNVVKPNAGDYVCKNLNCENGKKNGETWCISDMENVNIVGSAVGSRSYVASCFEGEIRIEGCADFNQEICIGNKDNSSGFTDAKCIMNDWRSCMYANDYDNYAAIESKCKTLPQCIMFNEIPGNEKYKDLPGFKDTTNALQGSADSGGSEDMNKHIMHCVPRFTPGYQFWTSTSSNPLSKKSSSSSSKSYGGSKNATDQTCGLGSFTCISHIICVRDNQFSSTVCRDVENPECNMQAVSQENRDKVPLMVEALNERCRSLGSCGVQYNTQQVLGDEKGFIVSRDSTESNGQSAAGYEMPSNYILGLLKEEQAVSKMSTIELLSNLATRFGGASELEESVALENSEIISGTNKLEAAGTFGNTINNGKNMRDDVAWGSTEDSILNLFAFGDAIFLGPMTILARFFVSLFKDKITHKYYITTFDCNAWQPPEKGNCDECNNDVRSCSEYKCRSIGENCRYFVENGEPGYCATFTDIWAAKITPWNEKLNSGNKYTNITDSGFRIVGNESNSKEVKAWKPVTFGIVTNEQAICKIDTNHSKNYDELKYTMISDKDYLTGKVDGKHHWTTLSPHIISGNEKVNGEVPALNEGDNKYYIICKNFAGSVNNAPYIVNVKQAEGPDLSPANVIRTVPEDNSWLAYNSTNLTFGLFLDEPAECKYSLEYDYNTYEEMPNNFTCINEPGRSSYGEWPCIAEIVNITPITKVFAKCKDQPGLNETDLQVRNVNRQSFAYEFSICQENLKINSIEPSGIVEVNRSKEVNLKVSTTGCINGGEANCAYRMPEFGNTYSLFLDTGKSTHIQPLIGFGSGDEYIEIECTDSAGNIANASTNFTVFYDDYTPKIIRAYNQGDQIIIETDEEANCDVNTNETKACDFEIKSTLFIKKHAITLTDKSKKQTLYLRCSDEKGNAASGCTEIIKLTDLKRGA